MPSPLVIAHISDLHVATFGDVLHDRAHLVHRGTRPFPQDPARYQMLWQESGWSLLRDQIARGRPLHLIDAQGYGHPIPRRGADPQHPDPVQRACRRAQMLHPRQASTLAASVPGLDVVERMLKETPHNTNLRLLIAARAVTDTHPDVILITGDLTDDGDGYELIEAAFPRHAATGRLWVVPGNHDRYVLPLTSAARPRPTASSKRDAWIALAGRLGLVLDEHGGWVQTLPEAETIVVGLDSCVYPQPRFYRQNGRIGEEQLSWLRELARTPAWLQARHRIVALHHHVVPLSHGVGRRAPTEIGMRLDDAVPVAQALNDIGCTFVLHGHRHISEERHPAGCNFRLLAAPSLTLGCKSGDGPSYWRLELGERAHVTRVRLDAPGDAAPGNDRAPSDAGHDAT